ncbi:MAG TPA: hypothetical protein VJ023_00325 [Pyrinomonadaceae bacterium]|nr:hypothetical protein [Pyrinomonadaceae bacterium]
MTQSLKSVVLQAALQDELIMVIKVNRKPRTCLECGSKRVAVILYGLPNFSDDELMRKEELGKIVFGGCVITGEDPLWQCVDCRQKYDRVMSEG